MLNGLEAFVGLPLMPQSTLKPFAHGHEAITARRLRYACTPCARSMDSYREGRRFSNSSPHDSQAKRRSEPEQKQRVPLSKAMVLMNVASHETCEFMIRMGCVQVNGEVVKGEKTRIDRFTDRITVNGTDFGTVQKEGHESGIEENSQGDGRLLPRTQRDFRRDDVEGEGFQKKFSRRVDRGFYANKRYQFGK